MLSHPNSLRFLYRETRVPGGASSIPRAHIHENVMATDIRPHLIVVQNTTLTPPTKRETRLYKECHIYNTQYICVEINESNIKNYIRKLVQIIDQLDCFLVLIPPMHLDYSV